VFDRGRPVSDALRLADPGTHRFAIRGAACSDLPDIGFVGRLVVGGVEFDLIVIQKDQGSLLMRRRAQAAFRGQRRRGGQRRGGADKATTAHG
jgi:hypothetical protein